MAQAHSRLVAELDPVQVRLDALRLQAATAHGRDEFWRPDAAAASYDDARECLDQLRDALASAGTYLDGSRTEPC